MSNETVNIPINLLGLSYVGDVGGVPLFAKEADAQVARHGLMRSAESDIELQRLREEVNALRGELRRARASAAPVSLIFRSRKGFDYAIGSIRPDLAEEIRSRIPEES